MAWERTGTIEVTQGSAAIVGTGTNWAAPRVKTGDAFHGPDGAVYEVLVVGPTNLTIYPAYMGSSGSGLAYSILSTASRDIDLVEGVNNLAATVSAKVDPLPDQMAGFDQRVAAKEGEVDAFIWNAQVNLQYMREWVVTVGGDENMFYPVVLAQDNSRINNIEISRMHAALRGGAGLMSLHARFVGTGGNWGGNTCKLVPRIYSYRYRPAMARWGQINHRIGVAFWMRGGGYEYRVRSTFHYANPKAYLERTLTYDDPGAASTYDWFVEPLSAVDVDMLENDFGLTDDYGVALNQI